MTDVRVSGLTKHYGTKRALHGIDLTIESGEFVTLLGPSGCGKTTTLRSIAGLEKPSGGRITMGDRVVVDVEQGVFVPPDKRRVGMVFQSYALWPHMTVEENVAYPLKVARTGARERAERVNFVLDAVGLADFSKRSVTALSGGQQQRVALARALAARSGVVFYDEPLSNLDTKLRYQMGQQLRTLHDRFETTSIYVTHDQEEAITLSDRIVVMSQGLIVQQGAPAELYDRPKSSYVADFMGFQNILPGRVLDATAGVAAIKIDRTDVVVSGTATGDVQRGDAAQIAFRSNHVRLEDGGTGAGRFIGTVERTTYLGSAVNVLVRVGALPFRVRLDSNELDRLGRVPQDGEQLGFAVSPQRAVVLPVDRPEDEVATTATSALVAS